MTIPNFECSKQRKKVYFVENQMKQLKSGRETHHNELRGTAFLYVLLCFHRMSQARNVSVLLSLVLAARRTSNRM